MSKLEEILQIGDKTERQRTLIEYAKEIDVNYSKARNEEGELSENELTVLIFDAEQSQKRSKFSNIAFVFVGFILFAFLIMGAFVVIRIIQGIRS